jgi:hypothetical protein
MEVASKSPVVLQATREILTLYGVDINKVNVAISARMLWTRQLRVTTAALDTAAGAVLVDHVALPPSITVHRVSEVSKISDALGSRLSYDGLSREIAFLRTDFTIDRRQLGIY